MQSLPRFRMALALASVIAVAGCREDVTAPNPTGALPALATAATSVSFRQLSGGLFFTCGVTTTDQAYCWGQNEIGQLGNGSTDMSLTPSPVSGGLRFRQVSVGDRHVCGVTTTDVAYCWGSNALGQLGVGNSPDRSTPAAVLGGHRFRQVSAGQYHTCAVTTADVAFCWGWNHDGQLGDGSDFGRRARPVQVAGTWRFSQVDAGALHTCGVTKTERAYCWGNGAYGQLGNGTLGDRRTPRLVSGGLRFRVVDAGGEGGASDYHSCGVTTDNRAFGWGGNMRGQLGDGTTTQRLLPAAVAGGIQFRNVSPASDHTCGVSTGNAGYCWGYNYFGALGDGSPLGDAAPSRLSPYPVTGGHQFATVTTGNAHSCGVTTAGQGHCWGGNNAGQLGDGTQVTTSTPSAVVGPS